jgi:hypothetical protein
MSGVSNNFQTMVSTGLAISLGATLMIVLGPNSATAYPSGSVSYGSNPIIATGGTAGATQTVFTAPAGHEIIVTDVLLTGTGGSGDITWYSYPCTSIIALVDTAGVTLASFRLSADTTGRYYYGGADLKSTVASHSFASGLPVSPGEGLELTHSGDCSVDYTLSGYYAEP